MIKQEIKSFEILSDGLLLGREDTPFSPMKAVSADKGRGRIVLRAEFTVSIIMYSMRRVILRFFRTLPGEVSIGGKRVGTILRDGDTTLDIKEFLHIGKNVIEIEADLGGGAWASQSTVGLVELVAFNHDIITAVYASSERVADTVRLHIKAETLENNGATRAVATLVSPGGRVYYLGMTSGEGEIEVTEPNPWWPIMLGVQNLYKLTVNLYADGEIIDSVEVRVGLAELTSDTEEPSSLVFNGTKLFMKAVCYGEDDIYLPLLDNGRIRRNLKECASLGFNTVIIRDTGACPTAEFFDACDELGLIAIPELSSKTGLAAFTEGYRRQGCHVSFRAVLLSGDAVGLTLPDCFMDKAVIRESSVDGLLLPARITLPTKDSLYEMLPVDERNLNSPLMAELSPLEDNSELALGITYRFPRGLDETYYALSLTEADRLSGLVSEIRRNRAGYTVFPTLTDPAPAVSASLIDHYGRRKAHAFAMPRALSPIYASAVKDGTRVTFFVSNETREDKELKFSYAVLSNDGRAVFRDSFTVSVAAFSTLDILSSDFTELVGSRTDEFYVAYSVSESFVTASSGTLLFTLPKFFKLRRPNIFAELTGSGTKFVLTLSSDAFAKGVEISFGDLAVSIEDNYFDIPDRSAMRIEVETEHATAIELLRRKLKIRSAYDIGREDDTNSNDQIL